MVMTSTVHRDGRILPATRWVSLVVFAILVPALVILWGMPGRTADAWAWTIEPDLTPIFLGAGYGAGAYFFLRTFLSERFHPSAAGVFGAAFFATLMLIATVIHWDRFNHGDAPLIGAIVFYGWVGVYIVSPIVVLALWWLNRRTDSGEPAPVRRSCRGGCGARRRPWRSARSRAPESSSSPRKRRSTSGPGSSPR